MTNYNNTLNNEILTATNNNIENERNENQIKMHENKQSALDWRKFLETEEFYLEAVGN